MLQVPDTRLHHIRRQISRQVAFPEELSISFDEQAALDFLSDVAACDDRDELESFTALLPRSHLNDLFGALLMIPEEKSRALLPRLLHILRHRLTPSLTEIGWAFFQNHFPDDRMNRMLETMIGAPAEKTGDPPYLRGIARVADLPTIDDTLPERLGVSLAKTQDTLLSAYLIETAILPESPFAAALLAHYFRHCSQQALAQNGRSFVHAVRINQPAIQIELVGGYFAQDRLEKVWRSVNQALLELFGPPRPHRLQSGSSPDLETDLRFWDRLDQDAEAHFRHWVMIDKLRRHVADQPRKVFFYGQCDHHKIREILRWDDKTLILVFDHFVLADDLEDEAQLYYYDLPTFRLLRDNKSPGMSLSNPPMSVRTARDVMLTGEQHNVVSLSLEAVNLLYSRDFIAEQLKTTRNGM